jgi:RHS repeat-associated protein
VLVENKLRLPGQMDDGFGAFLAHKGPYYNWHRYYSPGLGRYFQAEPLLQGPRWPLLEAQRPTSSHAYAYARNSPLTSIDRNGLVAVNNLSGQAIPASGNPGRGQGSGAQIDITIPRCGTVDRWHPTPQDVSDVDYLFGNETTGQKVSGTDYWPVYYCYLLEDNSIICKAEHPWSFCLTHCNAPSCRSNSPCPRG